MNYADQQRSPMRHVVGLGVVVLFHIALIYALVNGLGHNLVDVIKAPLEAKIIKDNKPPPPEAPPPPPPQLTAPPPPYVPPPDIMIQQPTAPSNAITAVTHDAPPPGPMAPTKPAAPPAPDHDVSERPISGTASPPYPPDMLEEEREGAATVSCNVDTSGATTDCAVTNVVGGQSFARSALTFAQGHRYAPATHNGVPVASRKSWRLNFRLSN